MTLRPADSWYEATARRDAPAPPLEGDVEADVCVVGAGLSGCSTALHLAERGYRVVLLEAERVGYGASGRSGGQIIPGYSCGMGKFAAQVGQAEARRLWDFSVEGVELTRDLIERNGIGRTEQFVPVAVPGSQPGELLTVRITGVAADGLVGEALKEAA